MEVNNTTLNSIDIKKQNLKTSDAKSDVSMQTEKTKLDCKYPEISVLKAYVGINHKEDYLSQKEIEDYFKKIGLDDPAYKQRITNIISNSDGTIARNSLEIFEELRERKPGMPNIMQVFSSSKENGVVNNKVLELSKDLLIKSKTAYGFDLSFLKKVKDSEGKFIKPLINFLSGNSEYLTPYLLRSPERILSMLKDNDNNIDIEAINYAESRIKNDSKLNDVLNDLFHAKNSKGKFSQDVLNSYNDLKNANLESWQINQVTKILSTFEPEQKKEKDEFIELTKSIKDRKNFSTILDMITDIKSDRNSLSKVDYNINSVNLIDDFLNSGYQAKENVHHILKTLNIPIEELSEENINTIKRLLQASNDNDVSEIYDAAFDKIGSKEPKLRFDKLNKYIDLYLDNPREVGLHTIKHLSSCLSLEENDKAFDTFYKLYMLKWPVKDNYTNILKDEKLSKDTLDFMLSMGTKELNGVPGRKCHPPLIDTLNKYMSMKLPMLSRDTFSNFMFGSDIKDIEKLERVNFAELGLNPKYYTTGKFQNLPEEKLLKFKEFLKDYLKDKNIDTLKFKYNGNSSEIIEITQDDYPTTSKLLYNLKDSEPISDVIEKKYSNSTYIEQRDYKHHVVVKQRNNIKKDRYYEYKELDSQIIEKYDNKNKLLYTEEIKPSEINGIYDVQKKYPDGRIKNISTAKITESGNTLIEKNMESLDGTTSYYRYEDDPLGNRIVDYKIKTADGEELLNQSLTFEVVDDNHFVSSRNNKKFDIKIIEDNMIVKDLQSGKVVNIELENFTKGTKSDILPLLKQLPGEDLFALKTMDIKSISKNNLCENAAYNPKTQLIGMNEKYLDPSILLHEIGHGKDELEFKEISEKINDDNVLNKIYNEEKEAFRNFFSDAEQNHIGYFAADYHYLGRDKAIMEGIAETNTILSLSPKNRTQALRSHYWQQYFPRTVAYLAKLLH